MGVEIRTSAVPSGAAAMTANPFSAACRQKLKGELLDDDQMLNMSTGVEQV